MADRFPPGEYAREELEARGISVETFAALIEWPLDEAEAFLRGEIKLRVSLAERLAVLFGTRVETWLNLERAYRAKP